MSYAQLQQYHIHSSNYIYTSTFVVGIVLFLLTFSYLFLYITSTRSSTPRQSFNFLSGSNPSVLAHIFTILYSVSLILLGALGMYIYYYELSPISWTKLFNQVIVCNGTSSNMDYINSAYNQYKVPLSAHESGIKLSLLKSISNFLGNHTFNGKDISAAGALSMSDGSFISNDRPPLLDYRNLFSRHYPFIYFTLMEEMKSYIRISTTQFFSFSILNSAYFITLSSLRATMLTAFDISSGGIFSSSTFILINLYGISRLLFFPIIDIWSSGGFRISRPELIEYFLSFQIENFSDNQENSGRFSWIIGCLKHYITIVERLVFLIILSFMIGKIYLKKDPNQSKQLTYSVACSPGEVIPFLLLQQSKQDKNSSPSPPPSASIGEETPPLLTCLRMLRTLVFWNLVSHTAIFSLNLSFKQLSLVQYPILADFLSLSVISSELLSALLLLQLLSTINETSSLFWRTPQEAEHDAKHRDYSRYNYGKKLDIKNPDDIEETFEDINSTCAIPRAVYKPPIGYELPAWAKSSST